MKGIGTIVILLGLLVAGYLMAKDLGVLSGTRDGKVVVEPLERAKDTAALVNKSQEALNKALDNIER